MAGTDVKAERKDLYAPRRGVFVDVVVPPMTFLSIDGRGIRTCPRTTDTWSKRCSALPTQRSS